MKKILVFITAMLLIKSSFCQTAELKEGQPLIIEGIEFIYSLGAESPKTIDGLQYTFFNLNFDVSNKGRFSKIFLLEKENGMIDPEFKKAKKAYLAKIQIINGIELPTTKRTFIVSEDPNIQLPSYVKRMILGNKKLVQEGFNLQSGQTLSSSIVVAVPAGQKPNVSIQAILSPTF